jgi:hypothetical protein
MLLFLPVAMVIKDAVKLTVEFLATFFLLQTTDCRSFAFKVVFCYSSFPIPVLGTATILHPGLVALDSAPLPHLLASIPKTCDSCFVLAMP